MNPKTRHHLAFACSLLLGSVLLLAALAKIEGFDSFLLFLRGLRHFPKAAVPVVGILVPALEIAIGACCVLSLPPRHVHLAGMALLGSFVVLQILLAIPALELSEASCPCFGKLFPENGSGTSIARAAAVFALSAVCLALNRGRPAGSAR